MRVEPFRQSPPFNLYNTNELVGRYEGLDGLRAGYLEASGWLLIATAQRGETRLISVVMGARTRRSGKARRSRSWTTGSSGSSR